MRIFKKKTSVPLVPTVDDEEKAARERVARLLMELNSFGWYGRHVDWDKVPAEHWRWYDQTDAVMRAIVKD